MPLIACGHCSGTHDSVAEVRRCAAADTTPDDIADGPDGEGAGDDPTWPGDTGERALREPVPIAPGPRDGGPEVGPGPPALGRSLVIAADAEVPAGWAHCRVVDATAPRLAADLVGLADELTAAWDQRVAVVVRTDVDRLPSPATLTVGGGSLSHLRPDLDLLEDRLLEMLWSNAAVLDDAGTARSPLAGLAVAAGAASCEDPGRGDVVLADGTVAWVDGGPLDIGLTGDIGPVLHRSGLDVGSLAPLRPEPSPGADLAPDQLAAVTHRTGPARIVAPAGSGKTRVLTERARHVVTACGVAAGAVTLVAFNKRAQLEMERRTSDVTGMRVRTLNALSLAIVNGTDGFLRSTTLGRTVQTIDEPEVRRILRTLVDVPRRVNTDPFAVWIEALTACRLGLADPADLAAAQGGEVDGLADVLDAYRRELRRRDLVDFDEQIVRAVEVLLADPAARDRARRLCRVLLVDEFQDLTPAHVLLVRLLTGPTRDLVAVGDDDQTIYGFTGASPRWLVDFEHFFGTATHLALDVNYRCAPAVVDAASKLLVHNRTRVDKTITAAPGRGDDPEALRAIVSEDPLGDAGGVVAGLLDAGAQPSDIAVLARVNVGLAAPQVALGAAGVDVVPAVGPELLSRTGVRAMLAWLRSATDPDHLAADDVVDTVRRPSRGLSRRVQEWMTEHGSVGGLRRLARRLGERDGSRIDGYLDDLEELAALVAGAGSTADALGFVADTIGLSGALSQLDGSRRSVDRSTHLDDLDALVQLATLEPDPRSFEPWLSERLDVTRGSGSGVLLSTVHRVKGQEWPHVVVVGANEATLPHRLADIEEERRVFHVAITRSRLTTTVVADASRPSRFLDEMAGRTPPQVATTPANRAAGDPAGAPDAAGAELADALRRWRLDRARADAVPAYVVFNDATLDEIVARRPTGRRELARVKGIGPAKLDSYGDEIVELVTSHR